MADRTLQDVIDRLVAEGQLTRNSGTNSIKTVKDVLNQIRSDSKDERRADDERARQLAELKDALIEGDEDKVEVMVNNEDNLTTGDDVEQLREEIKRDEKVIDLLEEIKENTEGLGGRQEKEEKSEGPSIIDIGLGAIVAGGALGATAGIVLGQLKAIETLIPPIETLRRKLRVLFKRTIPRQFAQLTKSIANSVRGVILAATIQFELIRGSFAAFGERFQRLLRPLKGIFAPFVAVVRGIGNYVGRITKSFTDAFNEIVKVFRAVKNFGSGTTKVSKALKPIQDGVKAVMGFFRGIGTVFARVAGFVGKIFAPIAIVMTVFDTLTATVEGYKAEGIIGGIKGFIKGFVNSLINMPLDLLKNGIAWLMGKFGVDPEKVEAVKNFSFVESFNNIIDSLFEFPSKAIDWLTTKFGELSTKVGEIITNIMGDPIGFVSRIIAAPYELLQKGIAWILGKFGFENAAEDVASFDIAGEIKKVVNRVIDFFKGVIDFYVDMFKGGAKLLGAIFTGDFDAVGNIIKKILRAILPDPTKEREWYDPVGLVQRAIPDAVYEYAGINRETGEMLELPEPEIAVPDPTPIRTELDTEEIADTAEQIRPRIEFETEPTVTVDGAETQVEPPVIGSREAQNLALADANKENSQMQTTGGNAIGVGVIDQSVRSSTNVTNSTSTIATGMSSSNSKGDYGV